MQRKTLFSSDFMPKPNRDRNQPTIWIRRIVLLREWSLEPASLIRDIEFRAGLNVIQTERRGIDDDEVVGHSVGKTLLMRLIRFSSGEGTFADEKTHNAIHAQLGSARVIAEWTVDQKDWISVRPLRHDESSDSYSIEASDWRNCFDESFTRQKHSEFVQAITDATIGQLPKFRLSRRSKLTWLDVLPWIARDCQCGYRKPNDWRHKDSNSDMRHDLDENSLIMQWVSGLMDDEEIRLLASHNENLLARNRAKTTSDSATSIYEISKSTLLAKLDKPTNLKIRDPDSLDIDLPDEIDVKSQVVEKVESLEGLLKESEEAQELMQLKGDLQQLRDRASQARDEETAIKTRVTDREAAINQSQAANVKKLDSSLFDACSHPGCPMPGKFAKMREQSIDEDSISRIEDARATLVAFRNGYETAKENRKSLDLQIATMEVSQKTLESERDQRCNGIRDLIGKWREILSDAERVVGMLVDKKRFANLSELDRAIRESSEMLAGYRSSVRNRIALHSECYAYVLRWLFGDNADGKIQVDGNGLLPVPDSKLAPAGTAMSVMTMVLGFDVASVLASVCGAGSHPRLLLHDSPREGDMEGPLFRRLFFLIADLEELFEDQQRSFQYIVSTTTSPPNEILTDSRGFVRLTLDARDVQGRLLKTMF